MNGFIFMFGCWAFGWLIDFRWRKRRRRGTRGAESLRSHAPANDPGKRLADLRDERRPPRRGGLGGAPVTPFALVCATRWGKTQPAGAVGIVRRGEQLRAHRARRQETEAARSPLHWRASPRHRGRSGSRSPCVSCQVLRSGDEKLPAKSKRSRSTAQRKAASLPKWELISSRRFQPDGRGPARDFAHGADEGLVEDRRKCRAISPCGRARRCNSAAATRARRCARRRARRPPGR